MPRSHALLAAATLSLLGAVGCTTSADSAGDTKLAAAPVTQPAMQLPPGWTAAEMQACMAAATPGKPHEHLAKDVGAWQGTNTMWMGPGAEPVKCPASCTSRTIMGGRYVQSDMAGDMPGGMGPYSGMSVVGFDNVSGQFTGSWVDNMGTGIATGVGELSPDGKTLTWRYTFNCPRTKKPAVIRQVETWTGPNAKTVEAFMIDPPTGKEYRSMRLELTRK